MADLSSLEGPLLPPGAPNTFQKKLQHTTLKPMADPDPSDQHDLQIEEAPVIVVTASAVSAGREGNCKKRAHRTFVD